MKSKKKAFHFKQFSIYQAETAMKVGTDAVILGAYCEAKNATKVLDIGCGTAVLSLMLAQKSMASITAIEIESAAAAEAEYNVSISPWKSQIRVLQQDFLSYAQKEKAESFDLIICNPPYFHGKNNRDKKSLARQNSNLPFSALFTGIKKLLTKNGTFYGIFPFTEKDHIAAILEREDLYLRRRILLKGNEQAAIKRMVLCIKKDKEEIIEESMTIEESRNKYTKACHELLKPYLLYL